MIQKFSKPLTFVILLLISALTVNAESISQHLDRIIVTPTTIIYSGADNYDDFFTASVLLGIIAEKRNLSGISVPKLVPAEEYVGQGANESIIIVGGPCANGIAAKYMTEKGYGCKDWRFPEGDSFIKSVGGALVVAGTEAKDTVRAVKALQSYESNPALRESEVHFTRYVTVVEAFEKILRDYKESDDLMIIYGDDETDSDLTNALEIAEYVYEFSNMSRKAFPEIVNSRYAEDYKHKNLILIGGPCANKVFEDIINTRGYNCNDWKLSSGDEFIHTTQNGEKVAILIAGTVQEETRSAIRKFGNYWEYPELNRESTILSSPETTDSGCKGFFCWMNSQLDEDITKQSETITYEKMTEWKNKNCYNCFLEHQSKEYIFDIVKTFGQRLPQTPFEDAERRYVLGKITDNRDIVCSSAEMYELTLDNLKTDEDRFIVLENLLFLSYDCLNQRQQYYYLNEVMKLAKKLDLGWKANIYELMFRNVEVPIDVKEISIERRLDVPKGATKMTLGRSKIIIGPEDLIGMQVDRTVRDWFSLNLALFSNHNPRYKEEKGPFDIDYMEGNILRRIINASGAKSKPLPNTPVVGKLTVLGYKWYAPDENGAYRFEVLPDKVQYLTTKCIKNVCLLQDTHGISSVVAQANDAGTDLVIGCGDSHAKMQAAYYLTQKGINVLYPPDRYAGDMVGYLGKGIALGSAPVREKDGKAVVGDQPVTIYLNEKIIIQTTSLGYPAQYYDAPERYFKALEAVAGINIALKTVDTTDFHQMPNVINAARSNGANVIAVRVAYEDDYQPVKDWLSESSNHRAVLFHSTPYPAGYRLFDEFPEQVTFGDPRPVFS